jgi:integrase
VAAYYRRWTAADAHPPAALVGPLAMVHCLRNGEIRHLRVADVLGPGRLRVGDRVVELAAPVADALARYLAWRARTYGGPSAYLLVSRASRLHDRPVSNVWFAENLLGIPVASLRQTATQQLTQVVGCDGLQVAAHTDLSLGAVGTYVRAFGRPLPPADRP